jgi:FAD/FMN-containing dehydrogenase
MTMSTNQPTLATMTAVVDALTALGVSTSVSASEIERLSRDYFWYSPILNEQLKDKRGQLIVTPKKVADIVVIAAICAKHKVPITVRGGGTGNYGQCVPLEGGVILDVTGINQILSIKKGMATVQAGVLIYSLHEAARKVGQQILMHPSTERIATIGGFVAGGHSGIGSIRHGILKDPGNISRIRVITLEESPKTIDLVGEDIQKVHHAYGTNGIIVELDVALTDAVDWLHIITTFPTYSAVLEFGLAVGGLAVAGMNLNSKPDIDVFQLSAVEKRITPYYDSLKTILNNQDAMFAQVSTGSLKRYEALAATFGGLTALVDTEVALQARGLPNATECAYNHTTLQALKSDEGVTYLQVAFPSPFSPQLVESLMEEFGDEVLMHHEFAKMDGVLTVFALPLVRYFDEDQINNLIARFEARGCYIFNPHTYWIEDGGMKQIDTNQIDFKKLADPMGLMNPGKTRGWHS